MTENNILKVVRCTRQKMNISFVVKNFLTFTEIFCMIVFLSDRIANIDRIIDPKIIYFKCVWYFFIDLDL